MSGQSHEEPKRKARGSLGDDEQVPRENRVGGGEETPEGSAEEVRAGGGIPEENYFERESRDQSRALLELPHAEPRE